MAVSCSGVIGAKVARLARKRCDRRTRARTVEIRAFGDGEGLFQAAEVFSCLPLAQVAAGQISRFESARVVFAFRLAALVRGLRMRRPGGLFQNTQALAQTGNDLFYQPGFFHFVICSLSMEDNSFSRGARALTPHDQSRATAGSLVRASAGLEAFLPPNRANSKTLKKQSTS